MHTIHSATWNTLRTSAFLIWQWVLLALVMHLLWEIGQLPLYTLWQEEEAWRIALYVLHCVLGDVMIAILGYLAVALISRWINWQRQRLWAGGSILFVLGLGYTVFSEWYNVYRIGSWAYSNAMPLIFGIGITPLLQWLLVPGVMLALIQRSRIGRSWQNLPIVP